MVYIRQFIKRCCIKCCTSITNQAIANHIDHFPIGVRNVEKVPEDWRGKVSVRQLDYFNQESMVEAHRQTLDQLIAKYDL